LINQGNAKVIMLFKHSKDFFAKDKERLRGIKMGEGMQVVGRIKRAIRNEAMDRRCQVRRSPKV